MIRVTVGEWDLPVEERDEVPVWVSSVNVCEMGARVVVDGVVRCGSDF